MLKWLTNLPIFLRLFLAFFLAALIPDIIIIIVSNDSQQVIIALLITTGVVTILGYFMNLTITQRLRHVAALTKLIERGETDKRANLTGRYEIYMVSDSINIMLDMIV